MKSITIIILLQLFIVLVSKSQQPYTQAEFEYDSIIDVTYGTAIDYAGYTDTLTMDIYKPIGDNNCKRPIIIFLHGGAWVVESKENNSMQYMSREMAKRGWVAANINYRLGAHKDSDYEMYMLCSASLSEPCAYICDTAEAIRANYRAMQDAKGAVRFLKSRNLIDSTDIDNVYMSGESAGAFTSFMVAYLDNSSEKPNLCEQINDAPAPSSYFDDVPCAETSPDLSRPDLGSIDGNLHTGTYNAEIQGVGSFFGGVFDISMFNVNNNLPCLYLFCQGSDVIVHYEYDKLFGRIDNECYNDFMCKNYENYPHCYGNKGIKDFLENNVTNIPDIYPDIIDNFNDGGNCMQTGHAIDSPAVRLQNMANFFAQRIALSGNNPETNCDLSNIYLNYLMPNIHISNNLINSSFTLYINEKSMENTYFYLYNQLGMVVKKQKINNPRTQIDIVNNKAGMYYLSVKNPIYTKTFKIIKQ